MHVLRDHGEVSCDLAMSKTRVTKETITITILELTATVLATQISGLLQQNLDIRRSNITAGDT